MAGELKIDIQAFGRLEHEMRQLDSAATAAAASAQAAASGVTRSGEAAARAARGWNRTARSIKQFAVSALLASGATAVFQRVASGARNMAASIVDAGVAAEALDQRFRFTFKGVGEGARQLDFVRREARRLGIDFAAAAQSFSGLAAATRGTAIEGAATREVFTAVAEAARVMGLSTSEAEETLTALERIASKGTVSAEDLRGQLGERLPGAFRIAARAMGVSTAELERMLSTGEVLSEDFLPRFAAQIRSEMSGAVPEATETAAAAFARLGNAMRHLAESIAASGVLDMLSAVAERIASVSAAPTSVERIVDLAHRVAADVAMPPPSEWALAQRGHTGKQAADVLESRAANAAALDAAVESAGVDASTEALSSLLSQIAALEDRIAMAIAAGPQVRGRGNLGNPKRIVGVDAITAPMRAEKASLEAVAAQIQNRLDGAPGDGADGPSASFGRLYARRLAADNAGRDRAAATAHDHLEQYRREREEREAAASEAAARVREQASERLEGIERRAIEQTMRLRLDAIELLRWEEEQALAEVAAEEFASVEEREAAAEAVRALYREKRAAAERDAAERRAGEEARVAASAEAQREQANRDAQERKAADKAAQRDRERADPLAGAEATLERIGTAAEDVGDRVGRAIEGGFRSAEDALVQFATTGRLEFASLTNSIMADLARIAIRQAIIGPLAGALGGALGGLNFGGGGGGAAVPAAAQQGNVFHAVYHSGGVAGALGGRMRAAPPAVFADAPRLHRGGFAGLRSDEVPAILQRGETVLPRGLPAAAPTEVRVAIENRGTPQQVTQAEGRFDGSRLVVSLVAEDIAGGGPVAGAIERSFAIAPRTG